MCVLMSIRVSRATVVLRSIKQQQQQPTIIIIYIVIIIFLFYLISNYIVVVYVYVWCKLFFILVSF